jgi:VWFA-related protein
MARAFILAVTFATLAMAQGQTTFKSAISLVEIDASVFDAGGIIEGLKQEDFVVKDERQPVVLRYCVQEDSPLDLILLFELTKMMAANRTMLRGAAEVAMAATREGDRLGVMAFSDGARLELPLSSDLKEVKRRVRSGLAYATFEGKPLVLSAVSDAAKYEAGQAKPHGRRAILMLGANAGFGLGNSHAGVTSALWDADTILGGVVIPTSWTRLIYDENPYHIWGMMNNPATFPRFDYIDDVAAQTGGEMIYTEDAGPMKQTREPYVSLRLAIEHMHRRYRLYYDLPDAKPGQRRRVQIELSPAARRLHPDARIIARKGYAVSKPGSM